MTETKDIRYLNKDFSTFKADLIDYAKSYFPNTYNDFTQASPGTMFLEMAAYVGDVMSFYLDNQLQETFLQYAKQPNNLYTLAYMLGYRPKVTSAAIVNLDVYQTVPAIQNGLSTWDPDWSYCLTINSGMQVSSNVDSSLTFYVPEKIDFTTSSSIDPTEVSVYSLVSGRPDSFLLKKSTKALSGEVKSVNFDFGNSDRFPNVTIQDSNIISILSVTDSSNNIWYEVPYLAQSYILNPVANTAANYPDLYQYNNQVPYMIEKLDTPRRFTTRFLSNNNLVLEFGSGVNSVADNTILPMPTSASLGLVDSLSLLNTAFDPTNFVTTQTYGLVPKNTTLTVQYLAGGGASSNVQANQLTRVKSISATSLSSPSRVNTVVTNNESPASGGGDGETTEELRLNTLAQYPSQMRAVTQQDYLSRVMSMPSKFGKISKVYVTKDDAIFNNYVTNNFSERDQVLVSLYTLSLDSNNNLAIPSPALLENLKTYLSEYVLLTDAVNIKTAYIINIGVNFEVVIRPNFSGQDVIARCITAVKSYFDISSWQINQPIITSNLYSIIDQVDGVQTVTKVEIVNKSGIASGYSKYSYDIAGATLKGVLYPSLDPSIFEVKYPNTDIQGRVVAY